MQIKYVARICFASRWTTEQKRYHAIRLGLLRKIVVHYECMAASVAEMLAKGSSGIGVDKLERRWVGGCCGNDRCVLIRALLFKLRPDVRDGRCLLADGD